MPKTDNELMDGLMSGEIKSHELSKIVGDESKAAEIRRKYLTKKYGTELKNAAYTTMDYNDANDRNIENMIGAAQVPLSYVEIAVDGDYAKKGAKYPVYLATTEGKLIAGVSRGAMAVNACGGARTKIINDFMTRSVIIDTDGVRDSSEIIKFVNSEEGKHLLNKEFVKRTKHGELVLTDSYTLGSRVFLIYRVKTKAAMGMNMVTIASSNMTIALVDELKKRGIECRLLSESGNMCTDKKASMINVIRGRGVSVVAEVVISREVLKERLKAEPEEIIEINYAKNYLGSGLAGSIAHNAHIANVLAAAFIAYGQDAAQVVDGAIAFDDAKLTKNGDLYFSVYLPALEIGTFGGGTKRETQMELLKSTGVYGEGDEKGETKLKFAELLAATCLSAELNLLAAEATGHLTKAHSSIKRGNQIFDNTSDKMDYSEAMAPANIKIAGEHSVVYGGPSLSVAIEKYATARAEKTSSDGLEIVLKDLGSSATFDLKTLKELYQNYSKRDIKAPDGLTKYIDSCSIAKDILPYATIAARLYGEHGVSPMGRRVVIHSELPVQSGYASSAVCSTAFAIALLKAAGKKLDDATAIDVIRDGERIVHKSETAGRMDVGPAYFGGYATFSSSDGVKKADISTKIKVVMMDTGPKPPTAVMVKKVRDLYNKDTAGTSVILKQIDQCVVDCMESIRKGDLKEAGKRMSRNHELLKALGVSSDKLDDATAIAVKNGAYGAKLCGGGGGGVAAALVDSDTTAGKVITALKDKGYVAYSVDVSLRGAKSYL
jgi:hydroxymethylglutaryl-CoA reductase (NADPH)